MNTIKDVFFDLDHTLWDFETNSKLAFIAIFKRHKVKVDMAKFFNYYVPINAKYWRLFSKDKITKEALKTGRLRDTFKILKLSISEAEIQVLATAYIKELPKNNELFPGVFDILNYLKGKKYRLHMITNGFNEVQYEKLKASKLNPYFNVIITSENVGVKKPNPIIFNEAVKSAETKMTHSIMIGDNWEADIMGAKNAGMEAIFCNFDNKPVAENIKSVSNLLEIKQFL
ncbi:MAG: noncanonical pyrimidine nucleotidase, YjjG family [Flavobacteriaceae bacterium]|nr:MAG: noncanonical pyrimidine nucleotidase, YjjG family [Flavobacteriaceae bacterium]